MGNTDSGREPVTLIEIDQALCSHVYGSAPCVAVLSGADPNKCFNTRKTCQDPANFLLGTPMTLRFCKDGAVVPTAWGAIPALDSVDTTPTVLNPGGASKNSGPLGARATVTIKMRDLPGPDFQVDPYQAQRITGTAQFSGVGYNPIDRGTWWSKWIRRNPYFLNFPIRIREGYIEETPAAMVTRSYIIEDISEPGPDGMVTISAQDILGMADDDKATCPAASHGLLGIDITATGYAVNCRHTANQWTISGHGTNCYHFDNSLDSLFAKPDTVHIDGTLAVEGTLGALALNQWAWGNNDSLGYNTLYVRLTGGYDPDTKADGWVTAEYTAKFSLTDWVAGEYPAGGGTVRIGDELMTFAVATEGTTLCVLSGIVRGTDGTAADTHSLGDRAQLCYRATAVDCWAVAYDLLLNYAKVPSAFIPYADWVTEGTNYLSIMTATGLVTEPTGVNQLLGELCEQFLFNIWWDERTQEIKLAAIRAMTGNVTALNDRQNIMADTWEPKSDMSLRVSEVWIYYKQKDPTKSLDDTKNYSQVHILVNPDLEAATKYQAPAIRSIYSRWLESSVQAIQVTARYLARFQDGAKYLKIQLDAKDRALWTGDLATSLLHSQVNDVGLPEVRGWQIISAEEVVPGEVVEYTLMNHVYITGKYGYYENATLPHAGYYSNAAGLALGDEGYCYQ